LYGSFKTSDISKKRRAWQDWKTTILGGTHAFGCLVYFSGTGMMLTNEGGSYGAHGQFYIPVLYIEGSCL